MVETESRRHTHHHERRSLTYARTHAHTQVVSCLRRLELLALEEKSEKKLQQLRQRALRQAAEAEAAGSKASPHQNGGGGGGSYDANKYTAGLRGKGDVAAAAKAKANGGGGGGGGVSQRQLGLVEMKLQVRC